MPNGKVYGIEGTDPLPLHEINPLTGATNRLGIAAVGLGRFKGLARMPFSKSNTRLLAIGPECFAEANLERLSFERIGCLVQPRLRIYFRPPPPPPTFRSRSKPSTQL